MGMALGAVADDRDLLAVEHFQVAVLSIKHLCHFCFLQYSVLSHIIFSIYVTGVVRFAILRERTYGDSILIPLQGILIRETRIVAQALLAIPDAPPACFAHWARQASVPLALHRFALV